MDACTLEPKIMALHKISIRKQIIEPSGAIRHLIINLGYNELREDWHVVNAIDKITGNSYVLTPQQEKEAVEAYISNEEQSPQGFQRRRHGFPSRDHLRIMQEGGTANPCPSSVRGCNQCAFQLLATYRNTDLLTGLSPMSSKTSLRVSATLKL